MIEINCTNSFFSFSFKTTEKNSTNIHSTVGECEIEKAADKTKDDKVLQQLWEITQDRLEEDEKRKASLNDRASKLITYIFSILMGLGFVLTTSSSAIQKSFSDKSPLSIIIIAVLAFLIILLFSLCYRVWRCGSKVLSLKEYKTWNKADLSKVELGSEENAYKRYLIKAAWKIIDQNDSITNEKAEAYTKALSSTNIATIILLVFISFTIVFNIAINKKAEAEKKTSITRETDMQDTQTTKEESAPKPTQTPSNGTTSQRDLHQETRTQLPKESQD